jgi:NAD(P)H dehydrogenase (quinone)
MRVLIVYCHPDHESFTAVVRDEALRALAGAEHETRVIDLYGEGFNPVLSLEQRRAYHTAGDNEAGYTEAGIRPHLEHLRWAEALVFVYPTWWYALPAMLAGWLDRVWVPHATFGMPEGNQPITRVMTNIRHIAAITTLGSPVWWWRWVGEPGRRILLRGIGALCHPRVKRTWLALHRIDTAPAEERTLFLARVRRAMSEL